MHLITNGSKEHTVSTTSSAYNVSFFWENLILKEAPLWEGGFQELPLTKDSLFIYTVVMDYHKNFIKNRWAYYPNVYALLGFLQYVFLPTSFFTLLDDATDDYYMPLATGEQLLQYMSQLDQAPDVKQTVPQGQSCLPKPSDDPEKQQRLQLMNSQLEEINTCWHLSPQACLEKLQVFSSHFHETWPESNNKLVYFRIFQNPEEIGDFVIKGGDALDESFAEVIEEEIGMTQSQWEHLCRHVYENPFMRKQFFHILHHEAGCFV